MMLEVAIPGPSVEIAGRSVVVRRYSSADAARLHEAIADSVEHLTPWMPWAALEPLELADRRRLIADWLERWERGEEFNYGMFEDGAVVGGCGLRRGSGPGGLTIGYWVRAGRTGRGIATEAAGCLVEAAFSMPDIGFVEVLHDVANTVSGRIPERLGFTLIEERADAIVAPAETGVERVWRLERSEWLADPTIGPAGRDPYGPDGPPPQGSATKEQR